MGTLRYDPASEFFPIRRELEEVDLRLASAFLEFLFRCGETMDGLFIIGCC